MSSIKKAGVTFYPGRKFNPTFTGKKDIFSLKYKLAGSADEFTYVDAKFQEVDPGVYTVPVTLHDVGEYLIIVEATDPSIGSLSGNVLVTAANIDDVKDVVDELTKTLKVVKEQVDLLDEETVNGISAKVSLVDNKLVELKGLLSDTDDDAIVSLRELLQDITKAGAARDGVISALTKYTDNLEYMLEGKEYVNTDGVKVSVEQSVGLREIYDEIVKDYKDVAVKVKAVQTVVDTNKSHLENSAYGLAALKALIEKALKDVEDTIANDVVALLDDKETGIVALRDSLASKLNTMDAKLDHIYTATASELFL